MKNRQSGGFKFAYIFLILIFVASITFLVLSILMPSKKEETPLNTIPTNTENNNSEPQQQDGDNPDKTPKQYESPSDTDKTKINASITKNEISGDKYLLRITIYEKLSTGTCELHMTTDNGDDITRSAKIIEAGADSSACEGFDIETRGMNSGTWNFNVTMTSGTKTGSIKGTINKP